MTTTPIDSDDEQTMANYANRAADATKILMKREMAAVLAELRRKAARSKSTRMNLVIFRLAACGGLRASEIAQLQMGDVRLEMPRPHLRIRASASKGGRPRMVPLWWDRGTFDDLVAWRDDRLARGAKPGDLFVCSWRTDREKMVFSRHTLRKRFRTACKVLGPERLKTLTIHHGRHTFISHALAGGRTLAELRDAAGHSNVSITSIYLHVAVEEEGLGSLFG
ncbi:tyrosine-type recombinase/integrase [Bythopirellula polymerisocia]|uniref:Tyrosine recombinase XerD n=1 Tax=Bythopirellula polymerisocia TaxID=2528003 RepID=A0A5C6CSR8_9BACT|nr:site-specific integrase [Bythopirellula polymerisocia]TWU27572.1 Tyrosine recombinase XerD [Bythopirellula polymerisocia]